MQNSNYNEFTKEQLISHVLQLENDFRDFSTQSFQVEDLLQQQLETCIQQLKTKDQTIRHMTEKLISLDALQSEITNLETDNDLLESTIRTLNARLDSEVEMHNECLEKISFLENELEWFKSSLKQDTLYQTADALDDPSIQKWKQKEQLWAAQISSLQTQLNELNKSKAELENQLKQIIHSTKQQQHTPSDREFQILLQNQHDLVSSLKKSEEEKKILKSKLKLLQKKYSKVHLISNMVKFKKHGLVTAYKTPALDPIA